MKFKSNSNSNVIYSFIVVSCSQIVQNSHCKQIKNRMFCFYYFSICFSLWWCAGELIVELFKTHCKQIKNTMLCFYYFLICSSLWRYTGDLKMSGDFNTKSPPKRKVSETCLHFQDAGLGRRLWINPISLKVIFKSLHRCTKTRCDYPHSTSSSYHFSVVLHSATLSFSFELIPGQFVFAQIC